MGRRIINITPRRFFEIGQGRVDDLTAMNQGMAM